MPRAAGTGIVGRRTAGAGAVGVRRVCALRAPASGRDAALPGRGRDRSGARRHSRLSAIGSAPAGGGGAAVRPVTADKALDTSAAPTHTPRNGMTNETRARRRRRWLTTTLTVFGLWIVASDPQRGPSIEQTFVAEAQAAAAADAMCLMPDRGESIERGGESIEPSRQTQIAIPTATDLSGDMPPLRLVVDPYPSFN